MSPYQGSLMRLAFTTSAFLAVLAGAFSYWQETAARKSMESRVYHSASLPQSGNSK